MGFGQGFFINVFIETSASDGALSQTTVGTEESVPTLPTQTQVITSGAEENVPTLPTQTQLITIGGEDGPATFPSPASNVTVV